MPKPPPPDITCPECGETNPAGFPACWACHADLTGVEPNVPAEAPVPGAVSPAPDAPHGEAPVRGSRLRLVFELTAVVVLMWMPSAAASVHARFVDDAEPLGLVDELFFLLENFGQCVLLVYLMWRGTHFALVSGLGRPRPSTEALLTVFLFSASVFVSYAVGALDYAINPDVVGVEVRWYVPETLGGVLVVVLSTFFAAASEELLFRAYLWNRLSRLTKSPFVGLVIAVAMFVAAHPYGVLDSVWLALFALLFGVVFWLRRSLWCLILAHAGFNLWLVVGDILDAWGG